MANGKIITFYSYKGGTGRSMALANVAWVLALNGKSVLAIDWDLEAPGLHRYFLPFLKDPELVETPGLIDLFWSYTDIALTPKESWPPGIESLQALADVQRYAIPLEFQFSDPNSRIHFLGAGRQEASYANYVRSFDWNAFYERLGGNEFIEGLRARAQQQYDFVLIDSRTGVADTSGICTMQLPDAVVLCFTYNRQSIRGVEAVAKSIKAARKEEVKVFPVAMRADKSAKGYEEAKQVAMEILEPALIPQFSHETLVPYWEKCQVPHYPEYSFVETLAVFKETPERRDGLLRDMVWLAETIGGGAVGSLIVPDLGAPVRDKFLRRFAFRDPRLSQLAEIQELSPSEAYSRLISLAASSADDLDDQAWLITLAITFDSTADRMRASGLTEQAVMVSQEGIVILRRIAENNQDARSLLAVALGKLATQYEELGKYQEAISAIDEATAIYLPLAEKQPELAPNLASVTAKRGALYANINLWNEALVAMQQAVSQYKKLAEEMPETFEPDLARCLMNVGRTSHELAMHAQANQAMVEAMQIYKRLSERNFEVYAAEYALCVKTLATSFSSLGLVTAANSLFLRAKDIFRQLPKIPAEALALDLSNQQLTELPESIFRLTDWISLSCANNRLKELPEQVGQLINLESLNLSGNQLTALPESLKDLHGLKKLYLHGNTSLGLPAEVLGPTYEEVSLNKEKPAKPFEILEYYFRLRSGQRPLNEARLIVVGSGGVGKSTLVNRLVSDYFGQDKRQTEGIRITDWVLQLNRDEEVRLHVWDFGGQEIMHSTHQFFLTQRSLYLLVLNAHRASEDAEYWLGLIKLFGGDSPVIVVLNKILEHPFDLDRQAFQQKYPAIRAFVETTCVDGTGINNLREAIVRETDELEHLRDLFPASWFEIKERLSNLQKSYLSFEEYRDLCARYGESDPEAQEALAGYLHNLGIMLYYKDDPRLQDTHVLNPQWVTNGIYKILNAERVSQQKGEFRLKDLSGILDDQEYPRSMQRYIVDLMRKFDLCFSFPDDETRYLIPELLDIEAPVEAGEFEQQTCMNFRYDYLVFPGGLLPRFIVRTNILSEGQPRWRTGVILKFEGNRALVQADITGKSVTVLINGNPPGRRRLLAIIRSDFERIHRDFRGMQMEELLIVPGHPEIALPYEELLAKEQQGIQSFKETQSGQAIELQVFELLNGFPTTSTSEKEQTVKRLDRPARLFYSYSHKDESLRNQLDTHLSILSRVGLIETWYARKIEDVGDDWKDIVDEQLQRADIILLLISANYISSDYCYEEEMTRALKRHEMGEARVIPILVRNVNLRLTPFAKLQALPENGVPVINWESRDSAWTDVSEGIEKVIREMQGDKP